VLPDTNNNGRRLSADVLWTIKKHQQRIVQLLVVDDDLISEMSMCACFTEDQLADIRSYTHPLARNKKLLKMLTAGSAEHFELFIDCVRTTQRHIVPLFTRNFGIFIFCNLRY
jgi:Caspase recruitment domain